MADRQQAYDNLPLTPLAKHVDLLCKHLTFGNLGHTPRPSNVERAYIAGFRDFNQANYETSHTSLTEAVSLAKKEAARDPTMNNLELLGLSLGALGFLKALEAPAEALALYTEALEVWETVHGKVNGKLVFLFMDLASLAKLANNLPKAVEHCQRARELMQASAGPQGLEFQGILINLATLKSEMKQNQEATALFTEAVNNLKALKHPSLAMALSIFHQHLESCGDKQKAADIKKEIDQLPKSRRK